MKKNESIAPLLRAMIGPLYFLVLIWGVFAVELKTRSDFAHLGIFPRTLEGLPGILFSPLVHASTEHLWNNTLPLFILLTALFLFYQHRSREILIWGWLGTGILTWVIGRSSWHIGASGLIYMLVSFLFFKGIFTKNYRLMALSLLVVFLYGSMVWYMLPVRDELSWEGHLSGFLTGIALALSVWQNIPDKVRYDWEREDYNEEEDAFMRQFDADGNFIDAPKEVAPGEAEPSEER